MRIQSSADIAKLLQLCSLKKKGHRTIIEDCTFMKVRLETASVTVLTVLLLCSEKNG